MTCSDGYDSALSMELESGCVFDSVFVLQEGQGSKRTISDLNVVMDASELQNFSSFLSG